jgi:hypothetical protein
MQEAGESFPDGLREETLRALAELNVAETDSARAAALKHLEIATTRLADWVLAGVVPGRTLERRR